MFDNAVINFAKDKNVTTTNGLQGTKTTGQKITCTIENKRITESA